MTASSIPPTANFDDPLLRFHAWRIEHVGIHAFLVALAAWQRGLEVTFHHEVATKCERFSRLPVQGVRGELFSVSDGRHIHFFCRAQGDATTREASARAEDKQATKRCLHEHGIEVPAGRVVDPKAPGQAIDFTHRHPDARFVLKPLAGTLGKGVHRSLTADEVLARLPTLSGPHLLEEAIVGREFRLHVVGERVVAAFERLPANVVGNGRDTLAELIRRKQALRDDHPVYRHSPLPSIEACSDSLASQGLVPNGVPADGVRVLLGEVPSIHEGGDAVDATDWLPESVCAVGRRIRQAMGLPNTGIDLIVSNLGHPDERVVVLEANQNPYITPDALPLAGVHPGGGNRIADAVIDHYFPASVDAPRHPQASFDFVAVCQALRGGTLGAITLPHLKADWVHRRLTVAATRVDDQTRPRLQDAIYRLGLNAQLHTTDTGDLLIDLVAPASRLELFLKAVRGSRA